MAETVTFLQEVSPSADIKTFEACARYYEPMDLLLYLQEDMSYRVDRVDAFLTLLWHPQEERAIGVKLKGFRYLFQQLRAILSAQNVELGESAFLSLVAALELAMTAGLSSAVTIEAERRRREDGYARARELLKSVRFDATPMAMAA